MFDTTRLPCIFELMDQQHSSVNYGSDIMAIQGKWYFTGEELKRTPSVLSKMSCREEQQKLLIGSTFVRRLAERLNILQPELNKMSQLAVSVALIQLRRFYTVHSLTEYDARDVGTAILFMTSKSEECSRRLDYFVRTWFKIRHEWDCETVDSNEQIRINRETYETFCEYITWLENKLND